MRTLFLVALALGLTGCSQQITTPLTPPPPTPRPVVPEVHALPGRGIGIDGKGSAQTEEISPDYGGTLSVGIAVVTLSHTGQSSFIVTAVQGGQSEVLTSAIGPYKGQRPLVVTSSVAFDVTADGDWSVKVQPMNNGGMAAFSGAGDQVSAYFVPPPAATWSIVHDGQTPFLVYAHCVGGSLLVADAPGSVHDQPRLTFGRGPCFWEVRGDGSWSLKPTT